MDQAIHILPHMCPQQKEDIEKILSAADDLAAAAVTVAHGGLGYSNFIDTRDQFRTLVSTITNNYRICLKE